MIKTGGQTTSVKTMAWVLNSLNALPKILLLPKTRNCWGFFLTYPRMFLFKTPQLHLFTLFTLTLCRPIPCFSPMCLPAEHCEPVESNNHVSFVVRERLDAIKTTHVYTPSVCDMEFNKTRSNIRGWLKTWTI